MASRRTLCRPAARWILLPIAWSSIGLPSPGQPAASGQPRATFYSTATVESRPLASSGASITVLDRAAIEASGARSVDELLRFVAGIQIVGDSSRSGSNFAQIRGGDPNFSLVLIDGVPVNDSTDQVGGAFNLAALPTHLIERIEVVRGPSPSAYGATGLAGVIHIFTRRGGEPSEGPAGRAPRVSLEIGGGDGLFHGAASLAGRRGRTDYFVAASRDEEHGRIASDRFEQWNALVNLGFELDDRRSLRLHTRYAAWAGDDYGEGSGGPVLGSAELRHSDHRELTLGFELELECSSSLKHKARFSHYRHDLERRSPAIFPVVPQSEEETTYERTKLGWGTVWDRSSNWRLSGGLDLDHESGDNASTLFLPPFLGGEVRGDYHVERTTPGAFLELLGRRGPWTLEVGSRLDAPEEEGVEVSPRIGVSHRRGQGARFHASVGRAFKLPSFFARYSPGALGGNPELEPETVISADLGLEWQSGERWRLDTTLFASEFRDLVDFDFQRFLHVNRSKVEARGLELTWFWQPAETLVLRAAVTVQEVVDQETGETLRHRSDWLGGASLRWRPIRSFTLELDGRAVSGFADEQIPVPGRTSVAGHQLWGLATEWRINDRWHLRARLDNLFGEDYETFIGFPGPERSFRATVRVFL